MHYLVIQVEDASIAEVLAKSIITNYMWINDFIIGDGEDRFYGITSVCEDITKVTYVSQREVEE